MKSIFRKIKTLLLVGVIGSILLFSSGCATVVGKGNYTVQVNSNTPGAVCIVNKKDSSETIFQGQTPCTVALRPGSDDYVFKVNGQEQEVNHQPNPWIFANIIWGPFFGIGAIVDMASGHSSEYPKNPLYFN